MLLSFAQFEREVIGERVRDKIAASKRKGIWVGGPVSLGYRCIDKKLVVVPDEAARAQAALHGSSLQDPVGRLRAWPAPAHLLMTGLTFERKNTSLLERPCQPAAPSRRVK